MLTPITPSPPAYALPTICTPMLSTGSPGGVVVVVVVPGLVVVVLPGVVVVVAG